MGYLSPNDMAPLTFPLHLLEMKRQDEHQDGER
jgi:hypothetical protein